MVWLHLLLWVALACVNSASSVIVLYHLDRLWYVTSSTLFAAGMAYAIAALWKRMRKGALPLPVAACLAVAALALHYATGWLDFRSWDVVLSRWYVLRFLAGAAFVLFLFFSFEYQINQFRRRERYRDLEERLLVSEVRALRNLVSPHFLFNSLNNIYALIHLRDERAGEYVLELGDLMRHILRGAAFETVALAEELDAVRRFVVLQRIKLGEPDVQLMVDAVPDDVRVPPMLLFHLVENCFKHGNLFRGEGSWVKVECTFASGRMVFTTENTVADESRYDGENIGLASVRAMLAHSFPKQHSLETGLHEDRFCCRLECELTA